MASLNIGRNQDDASFRYKMPPMVSKIEGRGNGIKTVILNMSKVGEALRIDADYPTKFFGLELGSQSRYEPKEDRAVVNGAHDGRTLSELLNKFIKSFILCPKCSLPEILWKVDAHREQIAVDCGACGNHSLLGHGHKLITYICKNPPSSKGAKGLKSPSGSKKDKRAKKGKGGDESDGDDDDDESKDANAGHQAHIASQSIMDSNAAALKASAAARVDADAEDWGEDTSKEAQAQRRAEEMRAMGAAEPQQADAALDQKLTAALATKEKDSPVYVLRRFMLQSPKSVDQIMAEVRRLELARSLTPNQKMRTCIEAILDTQVPKTIVAQLEQHRALLKKLAADKLQLPTLFNAFEEVIGTVDGGALLKFTPHILQALYEADLFDEAFLVCWHESEPETSLTVPRPVAVELRKKAQPCIDWLQASDSDDDDDDSDEDDE